MNLFDTHAHIDDPQLYDDILSVLHRATESSVTKIVAVGTTVEASATCIALAKRFPDQLIAAVGIQPNYCAEAKTDDWDRIVEMGHCAEVKAIGETGLDRFWDHTPFDVQQDYFDRHLRLSQITGKPFIVHMRDCMDEILVMLRDAKKRGPLLGVMHSYTGAEDEAKECIDLGLHLSFAGMVTFKKSDELRAVAATIPDDRILIETDAPYLSPHPRRAQRPNEPALIVHTAECLAQVRGVSLEAFAQITYRNSCEFFQLPKLH